MVSILKSSQGHSKARYSAVMPAMDKTCKRVKRTMISFNIVEWIVIGEKARHKSSWESEIIEHETGWLIGVQLLAAQYELQLPVYQPESVLPRCCKRLNGSGDPWLS